MKFVLLAHRYLPHFLGGVEVYTHRLARALDGLGHQVVIIALDPLDEGSEAITVSLEEYDRAKVWRLKFSPAKRPWQTFIYCYDPEVGRVVQGILREEGPSVLVIMNFHLVTLAPVEAAHEIGVPVVHIATDFTPLCRRSTLIQWDGRPCRVGQSVKSCAACHISEHPLGRLAALTLNRLPEATLTHWANNPWQTRALLPAWKLLSRYWNQVAATEQRLKLLSPLIKKIDLVLAPTRFTLNKFLASGFQPEQLHHLPFGIAQDTPLSTVEHIPADHIRFLFIGRFLPYKGAHLLIQAFNRLRAPKGASLTLYGDADGHDAYHAQLKTMAAPNERIRFAGRIAPTALADAFAEADFFVLPSLWHENSPLIFLDAVHSKTPVLASDIGGVADVIKPGVNGLLFPMGNGLALQQLMQQVIDQPELAHRLRVDSTLPRIEDYAKTLVELCPKRPDPWPHL